MFSDPEHMRWYPAPFDRDGTQAWIERTFERYRDDGFGLWIVEDRATGTFLGTVGSDDPAGGGRRARRDRLAHPARPQG